MKTARTLRRQPKIGRVDESTPREPKPKNRIPHNPTVHAVICRATGRWMCPQHGLISGTIATKHGHFTSSKRITVYDHGIPKRMPKGCAVAWGNYVCGQHRVRAHYAFIGFQKATIGKTPQYYEGTVAVVYPVAQYLLATIKGS